MYYFKKLFALILMSVYIISSIGNCSAINANESHVQRSSVPKQNSARGASMEDGLNYTAEDFSETNFNGSDIFLISDDDATLFQTHMKNAIELEISITFKVSGSNKNYINLLEIADKSNNSPDSENVPSSLAVIVSKTGVVYFESGSYPTGTDWSANTGINVADGQFHTLSLSVSANRMKCQIDNSAEKETSSDGARNTKKYMTAFFGGNADNYKDWRQNINCVAIGGLYPNSYFENSNYENLNGEISHVSISGVNSSEITGEGIAAKMFEATSLDNTWLFAGGVETQGRFAEIGGIRNYIGHFEEYIRWEKRIDSTLYGLQRYTINIGQAGLDAVSFAAELDEAIFKIQPMAVAYLIGPEDYNQGETGIEDFKKAISDILDMSLAMKNNNGCVVIQLPHAVNDEQKASYATLYANAAREVVDTIVDDTKKERIAVVNHFKQTNNDLFKTTMLTNDNLLNSEGHYEIAKQLAKAICGTSASFPVISDSWTQNPAPSLYENVIPKAIGMSDNSLQVSMPDNDTETNWNYILTIDDVKITGTAYGNPFTIENLPANKTYCLTLQTKDGTTQFSPITGTIEKDFHSEKLMPEAPLQKAIRNAADSTEHPLTWLFMGDSITHAAAHTHGYDGIAQIFEKYLKEDLGRTNDIVINTGVSGATTIRTLENIEQRMTKYNPDIVSIMLGTNDSKEMQTANYRANFKEILNNIKSVNPNALIILRSPTPAKNWAGSNKYPGDNGYIAALKSLADEDENILFIDQYTTWNQACAAYPYLYSANYHYGDGSLHPGAAGQLKMAQQFIRECGLNTNTNIANLSYRFSYEKEESEIKPDITISTNERSLSVSKTALNAAYTTGEIGDIIVTLTSSNGQSYEKSSGLSQDEVTFRIPTEGRYSIQVSAILKGGIAKLVTFASQDIVFSDISSTNDDILAAKEVSDLLDSISSMKDVMENIAEIESARTAFESLSDTQKLLVPNISLKLLTDAELTINQKKADEVKNKIHTLTALTELIEHKREIEDARNSYESLTLSQKNFISIAELNILTHAESEYNRQSALFAAEKINDIGDVKDTLDCKQKIETARKAYDALTEDQKQLISDEVKKILTDAEKEYARLTKPAEKPETQNPDNGSVQTPDNPSSQNPETYSDKNCLYQITDEKQLTAELVSAQKNISKINVPSVVLLNGKHYKVTSIAASAFKNNKLATGASIGKNVSSIGKNAFVGCSRLKTITIKSTVLKQIGSKAFFQCRALKKISIKSKHLKSVGKNAWKGIHKNAEITVPSSKLKAYKKLLSKKGQGKNVKIKK